MRGIVTDLAMWLASCRCRIRTRIVRAAQYDGQQQAEGMVATISFSMPVVIPDGIDRYSLLPTVRRNEVMFVRLIWIDVIRYESRRIVTGGKAVMNQFHSINNDGCGRRVVAYT
jgi:hypothetical protein